MTLKIVNSGLATTIQDLGRPGYFHLGIPEGGAMDRLALRAANMLLGNPEDAACLEAVFMGPEIEFARTASVAVTGAEMPVMVDGTPRETWTSFTVQAGQVLSFGFLQNRARAYIAVSGGIATEPDLGSRVDLPHRGARRCRRPRGAVRRRSPGGRGARCGRGPHGARGPAARPRQPGGNPGSDGALLVPPDRAAGRQFFDDTWTVAAEADRMGYRFKGGRPLEFVEREQPFGAGADPSNIVDGCYSYGSIQVPGGTEPIVLHRDAVSGGGYFTLGAVISADMDLIGQLQPNTQVKFVNVDMDTALAARAERKAAIRQIRDALA